MPDLSPARKLSPDPTAIPSPRAGRRLIACRKRGQFAPFRETARKTSHSCVARQFPDPFRETAPDSPPQTARRLLLLRFAVPTATHELCRARLTLPAISRSHLQHPPN